MPVQILDDGKKIRLVHPKGPSAEVLLYGATVLSWKARTPNSTDEPSERLFVSAKAVVDGSKAVRGGIPVVFPFFGAPTKEEHKSLPQHGYARNHSWKWDGNVVLDNESSVSVKLTYEPDKSLTQDPVALAYSVTLTEHQLSTFIHVTNTAHSGAPIEFQSLLHTYFRVPSQTARVSGLNGLYFTDKTASGFPRKVEERELVDVLQFTDSVYEDGPRDYRVVWPDGGISVKAVNFKDVVVWNPNAEASSKLADMEDGGWERFVCVEVGHVTGWAKVEPSKTWMAGQNLTLLGNADSKY